MRMIKISILLLALFLVNSCRPNQEHAQKASSGFLYDQLNLYKGEHGKYPEQLEEYLKSDVFRKAFPKNRIRGLELLLNNDTFDYGGGDDSKSYLFKMKIGGKWFEEPKLPERGQMR